MHYMGQLPSSCGILPISDYYMPALGVRCTHAPKRSPASHGPADWEVVDKSGKIVGLFQVKTSRTMQAYMHNLPFYGTHACMFESLLHAFVRLRFDRT